jgi:hypothetical protein
LGKLIDEVSLNMRKREGGFPFCQQVYLKFEAVTPFECLVNQVLADHTQEPGRLPGSKTSKSGKATS